MKEGIYGHFFRRLCNEKTRHPLIGHIELTYRCNFNCIHCYCKGLEDKDRELNTTQWKKILDEIQKEGCFHLILTGGEPLIREDFGEIYLYAKRKGFLIDIFTNGTLLIEEKQKFFQKYPPHSIEITLNGISKETYEAITQTKDFFDKVMANIKGLASRDMPIVIKTNCLKQNKDEIAKIKTFSKELLGKDKKRFKFDSHIYPRLNQDKTPCKYRLSPTELKELMQSDSEIYAEHEERLKSEHNLARDRDFLYQCNSWLTQFFINPYGKLKFCQFTETFSTDLIKKSFKNGFYKAFPMLMKERFKSDSKCKDCKLRMFCLYCPARAYLETGDEESPVSYFCALAKSHMSEREKRMLT